ncbi:hypothetical protein PIB30_048074 [Stylosanthes scabra]|uniref:Putative plant transposon protein domain-containing protein n=1 Tax=Stylosanthes scabra TaxID=79078 RepID=A0ABU6UIC7_9FABA|nr:hypothetical protein [Stylosanthes scabra]
MRFKDDTPGAETDYSTRLHSNQMLEEVLSDLCIPGATWKLGGGQPPQPIQLRRKELQPLARGWFELIIHNIHPSSNRSEVIVANAILIHSIIKGEDVRVKELISTRLVNIAQSLQHKGKLGFSSLIYKLCKDAGVSFREYRRTPYVEVASKITAKVMETVRGGALPILRRHQEEAGHDEDQDQVMYEVENVYEPPHQQSYFEHETGVESWANHEVFQEQQQQGFKTMTNMMTNMQIETLNYFENIKTYQEYQYDQMKSIIAQQQEVIAPQNREFQAMKKKQDQLEKELSDIKKAQINPAMNGSNEELQRLRKIIEDQRVALVQQNRASAGSSQIIPAMIASSEEKLDKIASSVAKFKEELTTFKERHEQLANLSYKQYTTIRKEQESMAKEVKEIKEKQINPIDNETLKDVARMTFEQREELKQIRKQMREWTMYSSARECYDVWAHQQSNPNLVQMPLHDLTKMVYDNLENKRPMFSGALKSDPNAGQASQPEPIPPEDFHLYNNQQVSFFEE